MYQFILLIHVFAAICIIALVLVQQGKGATMGAAFGSGASQTIFGSRGSGSFLFRVTAAFVAIFFITSISLNYLASRAYRQERVITLPEVPAQQIPVNTTVPANAVTPAVPAAADVPANNVTIPALPIQTKPAGLPGEIPTNKN